MADEVAVTVGAIVVVALLLLVLPLVIGQVGPPSFLFLLAIPGVLGVVLLLLHQGMKEN